MPAFTPVTSERAARAALAHFAYALPDTVRAEIDAHGAAATWNRHAPTIGGPLREYRPEPELIADMQLCEFVIPGDPQWPGLLDELGHLAPLGLWSRRPERLPELTARSIFVAGNRHSSPSGQRTAGLAAAELAEQGVTVVTVSSWGIGSGAVGGVLAREAAGVLVMPCGLNNRFPDGVGPLSAALLANGGALVSLQRPRTPASGQTLAAAPRLAAALSAVTFLVESRRWTADALSAHAVGAARDLHRPVLALDTRADADFNPGNAALINDGIARPASSALDALSALPATPPAR